MCLHKNLVMDYICCSSIWDPPLNLLCQYFSLSVKNKNTSVDFCWVTCQHRNE